MPVQVYLAQVEPACLVTIVFFSIFLELLVETFLAFAVVVMVVVVIAHLFEDIEFLDPSHVWEKL